MEAYRSKINEAIEIKDEYFAVIKLIINRIGVLNKRSPNRTVASIAKNNVIFGAKLAGQIIAAVNNGHLQLAVVGLRSLFEMSVNTIYVYNHPRLKKRKCRHAQKICKEILKLSFRKKAVNHSRLDNKSFRDRLNEIKMGHCYNTNYRIMSDWAHLMLKGSFIEKDSYLGKEFGTQVAGFSLQAMHNIFDSVCAYYRIELDQKLETSVVKYLESMALFRKPSP